MKIGINVKNEYKKNVTDNVANNENKQKDKENLNNNE